MFKFKNKKLVDIDNNIFKKHSKIVQNKILSIADHNSSVSMYVNLDFSDEQLLEILKGLEEGVNVSCYAKHYFSPAQMQVIRKGLLEQED